MDNVVLKLEEISKAFGSTRAVDQFAIEIHQGEVCTLLGPSGCGKTTTLRLVGGLERPDHGEISYQGRTIVSVQHNIFVPPHRRNMGMVFQSYAIWPNKTVWQNVAYPLQLRRLPTKKVRELVAQVLELVGLTGFEDRPSPLLSGGQQQRVALARSLVYEPSLLLLDEPFSNLDAKLREQMRVELKLLQRRLGITILFVTHDQIEALSLSDRIVVMNQGRIEQIGLPQDLYDHPQTPFVRDFVGKTILVLGKIIEHTSENEVRVRLHRSPQHTLRGQSPDFRQDSIGQAVYVAIRPEAIVIRPEDERQTETNRDNRLTGQIKTLLFVGDRYECRIQLGKENFPLYLPRDQVWREDQNVSVSFSKEAVSLWPVPA